MMSIDTPSWMGAQGREMAEQYSAGEPWRNLKSAIIVELLRNPEGLTVDALFDKLKDDHRGFDRQKFGATAEYIAQTIEYGKHAVFVAFKDDSTLILTAEGKKEGMRKIFSSDNGYVGHLVKIGEDGKITLDRETMTHVPGKTVEVLAKLSSLHLPPETMSEELQSAVKAITTIGECVEAGNPLPGKWAGKIEQARGAQDGTLNV